MASHVKASPEEGRHVVGRALRDLWPDTNAASTLGGRRASLSDPLPLYQLRLDRIDGPDSVYEAEQVGWRYLLEKEDSAAFADVTQSSGGQLRFASLSRNANAQRLLEATTLAGAVAAQLSGSYDIRVLDISALRTSTVWLAGPENLFVPYIDKERLKGRKIEIERRFMHHLAHQAELAKSSFEMRPSPRLMGG